MRTRAEIDQEYGIIARVYGDRVFKGAMLQNEIKALHDKMTALSQEPAAPEGPVAVPQPEKKNEPVAAPDSPVESPA
jgi:hypothetical protein